MFREGRPANCTKKFPKPFDNITEFGQDSFPRYKRRHPDDGGMLLNVMPGPTNFNDLKFFEGTLSETYREACQKRQLLLDDQHLQQALQEATETSTAARLRTLFAIILSYCEPANPRRLWDLFRNHMAEDILYRLQQETIPT